MTGEADDRSGGGIDPCLRRGLGDGMGCDGRRL